MNSSLLENKALITVLIIFSALSFIPLIGVFFGTISIIISLLNFRRLKIMFILGLCGILFTTIIYSSIYYFGFVKWGGKFDELRVTMNAVLLQDIEKGLSNYKSEFGEYPEDLNKLLIFDESLTIKDPIIKLIKDYKGDSLFYYKCTKNNYELFSVGFDGIPNTDDDVFSNDMYPEND